MVSRDDGRSRGRDPLVREGKFPLGQLVQTPGVIGEVPPSELFRAIRRHASGDWGEVGSKERLTNEQAVADGATIRSVYDSEAGVRFWVVTDGDRISTTAMLPVEYFRFANRRDPERSREDADEDGR